MGSKLIISSLVVGSLLVTLSLLVIFYQDKFINNLVAKSVQLIPTTDLYKDWLNPPFDVYMKFYLFNLKNGEDFEKGAKPLFEEIGPFVYKESRIKEDIKDNLNYTISYKERKRYQFVQELSPYQESYPITSLSMAAITVINFIHYSRSIEHKVVNVAFELTGETLIIKKTAREILWGYQDKLLAALHTLVPTVINSDIVGLMYGQNDTIDGEYTIYTGVDDISKMGIIERYNRRTSVSNWPTKYANMINGSDGTLSPPFVDKNVRQYAFQSNLCRSLYGMYNGSITIKDNIELWGFAGNEYIFANASVNPDNADFCTPLGNCLEAGLINMTECLQLGGIGLPIILSNPHFLFADEKCLNDVDGISAPILELHNTLVYVEPLTGIELKANQRLQFNANCINDTNISVAKNVRKLYFPLMWLDECFEADNKTIDKFYSQVKLPVLLLNISKYSILSFGCLLLIITIILVIVKIKNRKNTILAQQDKQDASRNWISNETTPLLLN